MLGIDQERVTAWFASHVPSAQAPLTFELLVGGHSNLTFKVTDDAGPRWVLRRPPLGPLLPSAHDMRREHRIMSAPSPTDVPVPEVVGMCDDVAVNDAPFYVMQFVDGHCLRDPAAAHRLGPEARRTASRSAVTTLAHLHAIDPDVVGLGDLARRTDYVGRQLRRWYQQWERTRTRDLPMIDRVYDLLVARLPAQRPASGVRRARGLPARQLPGGRRRHGRRGARLGAVHAGRPAGGCRAAARLLE